MTADTMPLVCSATASKRRAATERMVRHWFGGGLLDSVATLDALVALARRGYEIERAGRHPAHARLCINGDGMTPNEVRRFAAGEIL